MEHPEWDVSLIELQAPFTQVLSVLHSENNERWVVVSCDQAVSCSLDASVRCLDRTHCMGEVFSYKHVNVRQVVYSRVTHCGSP